MSTLNWGDLVKDAGDAGGSYDPLPDGDYDLVVLEAQAKVSQSGKTMFAIKAQVETGAHARRFVWDNLVISPENQAALGIFFRKMYALGLNRDYFASNPTNAQIEAALVGRRFRATIGSRTWQGQKKNEIKNYFNVAATAAAAAMPAAAAAPAPAAAAPAPVAPPPPPPAPSAAPAAPF